MAEEIMEEQQESDSQKGQFMTFKTGKENYGISISYINEIIQMQPITAVPEVEDYIKGLINLRGKIIPVIDIRVRFKMQPLEYNDRTCIIVINLKSMVIGIIVETIAEVITVTDEDIVPPPTLGRRESEQNKYVYGLARVGDSVTMLLDPEKLVKDADMEALEEIQDEDEE